MENLNILKNACAYCNEKAKTLRAKKDSASFMESLEWDALADKFSDYFRKSANHWDALFMDIIG